MKNRFTHDNEQQLISFLKAHQPVPPKASKGLEEQLMRRIEKEPISSKYSPLMRWIVPSTLAASLLMIWGGYHLFSPVPKVAANSAELEAFLIDNWTGTMEDSDASSRISSTDISWFNLTEPQVKTYYSQP